MINSPFNCVICNQPSTTMIIYYDDIFEFYCKKCCQSFTKYFVSNFPDYKMYDLVYKILCDVCGIKIAKTRIMKHKIDRHGVI